MAIVGILVCLLHGELEMNENPNFLAKGTIIFFVPYDEGFIIASDTKTIDIVSGASFVTEKLKFVNNNIAIGITGNSGFSIPDPVTGNKMTFNGKNILQQYITENYPIGLLDEKFINGLISNYHQSLINFLQLTNESFKNRLYAGSQIIIIAIFLENGHYQLLDIRVPHLSIDVEINYSVDTINLESHKRYVCFGDCNYFADKVLHGPGRKYLPDKISLDWQVKDIDYKLAQFFARDLFNATFLTMIEFGGINTIGLPAEIYRVNGINNPIYSKIVLENVK